MARSYFILTLDTMGPSVLIGAPSYTTKSQPVDIIVESNEPIDVSHEFYVVDALGTTHPYTLSLDANERRLNGFDISFDNYPIGIATIHARLTDKVGNKSSIVTRTMGVLESFPMVVDIDDTAREVLVAELSREIGMEVLDDAQP